MSIKCQYPLAILVITVLVWTNFGLPHRFPEKNRGGRTCRSPPPSLPTFASLLLLLLLPFSCDGRRREGREKKRKEENAIWKSPSPPKKHSVHRRRCKGADVRACNNCNFDNLSEFVTKQICQDDGTDLFRALEQQEPKQPGTFMNKIFWHYKNKKQGFPDTLRNE